MPKAWNVPEEEIERKLNELFSQNWIDGISQNFMDCLRENI